MEEFKMFSAREASGIQYVLCDIDDTITTHGKLGAEAYAALWRLKEAGIQVIPVTGRPAGWCDLIIRQWPVKAVVGENGAFCFYWRNNQLATLLHPELPKEDVSQKLAKLGRDCIRQFPGCRLAKDQFARKYDLAVDFNEDPPYLGFETGQKIQEFCIKQGAEAKLSSIHVNAWYGKYDKLSMALLYLEKIENITPDVAQDKLLYFGDSPNDEPMFAFFKNSCGVANIKPFLPLIKHPPRFVTGKDGGEGFAEAVDWLLNCKG